MSDEPRPILLSIVNLTNNLYEELLFNGDAITTDDIKKSIMDHLHVLAGWQKLTHHQESLNDGDEVMIEYGEWAILRPVVRAHLDCMQAKRMEGSRAISGDSFGKDVNTAYQDYKFELDELPKKAFCERPFWI